MTYAEREDIFSKEVLTIADIARLYDVCLDKAGEMMRDIKRHLKLTGTLRVDIQGKLHTQDYFDYFNIKNYERYVNIKEGNINDVTS